MEGDRFCRNCGAALSVSSPHDVRTGRFLIIASSCILLGIHAASVLFSVYVDTLTGTTSATGCLSDFVSGSIEIALLFFIFRGHTWARWLTGLLSLAAAILAFAYLPNYSYLSAAFVLMLALALGAVFVAAILLLAPSVRSFQRYQKEAITARRKRAA
jgi:hypothetical protein